MIFPTDYNQILNKVDSIDPVGYGKTRNFIDGAVTRLSPYISRGVISSRFVMQTILNKGYKIDQIEKFIQELAWRDYWQQLWKAKGNLIDSDLKQLQPDVQNYELPQAIVNATTGIEAIDKAIIELYDTGYMHNHLRMYVASLACNIGKSHWSVPARWMYYHLLDGDWASNALSWQWVAGSNSSKKYYANQQNINRYCYTTQQDTFLDVGYESLPDMPIPQTLEKLNIPQLTTSLPKTDSLHWDPKLPACIYNLYNIDQVWRKDIQANRIFLLEPSVFEKYPVSSKTIDFALDLSANIEGIQVFVGSFDDLLEAHKPAEVFFKEHPLNRHYRGIEDSREWMFRVEGYFPSFFAFWKKCARELGEHFF